MCQLKKMLKVHMTSLVDKLPTVQLPETILPQISLPKTDEVIDDNDVLIDQSPDPFKESSLHL